MVLRPRVALTRRLVMVMVLFKCLAMVVMVMVDVLFVVLVDVPVLYIPVGISTAAGVCDVMTYCALCR